MAYVPPIGIPPPSFGIDEVHTMYLDPGYTYDYGSGPEVYHTNAGSPYTHYIDNTHGSATDSGNSLGTPTVPRLTIPATTLPAGSVVEIHGGPYTSTANSKIYIEGTGTSDLPIFIRGISGNEPRFFNTCTVGRYGSCYYVILENIDFYVFEARYGSHHIAARSSFARNGNAFKIYSGLIGTPVYDIVFYNNVIYDNGDWESEVENDVHGVSVRWYCYNVWILDNEIYHNGGDSVQIDALENDGVHHVYIGGNEMHEEGEDAIDVKECRDVIISQNEMHSLGLEYAPRGGTPLVLHYGPERIWVLLNHVHDSGTGLGSSSSNNVYFIGNVIHDIHHGVEEGYDPEDSASTGSGLRSRSSGTVHFVNNTIYNCDMGIAVAVNDAVHLVNNIVKDISDTSSYHIIYSDGPTAGNSNMQYNLLHQDGDTIRIRWGGDYYYDISSFQSDTGKGVGCVEDDPLFIDAPNSDFHLNRGSPTINAGSDIQGYIDIFSDLYGINIGVDFDGVAR